MNTALSELRKKQGIKPGQFNAIICAIAAITIALLISIVLVLTFNKVNQLFLLDAIGPLIAIFLFFRQDNYVKNKIAKELGHKDLSTSRNLRLINVVEGICLRNGLEVPVLYEVDANINNAAVFYHKNKLAFLFTTSYLKSLERLELEGIVAHLAARYELGEVDKKYKQISLLGGVLALLKFIFAKKFCYLGPEATYMADYRAFLSLRYPLGLAQALGKLTLKDSRTFSIVGCFFIGGLTVADLSCVSVADRIDLLLDL